MTLEEIRARYFCPGDRVPPLRIRAALEADGRSGAAGLLETARARLRRRQRESRRSRRLLRYETALWQKGLKRVAGVDEAGVGPLAGPVVAAAVVLPPRCRLPHLDDSKVLPQNQRETLFDQIQTTALALGIGLAEASEVDMLNVYQAGLVAMQRAVTALGEPPEHLLVDARRLPAFPGPQQAILHGDALSASIAAASVIAKVTRDRIMARYDHLFPGYGFARHKGYATRDHRQAVLRLGPCAIHRRTFSFKELQPRQQRLFESRSPS